MKENYDPHQVIISREYFDKLVELAKPNDCPVSLTEKPNQTIIGRILWHARKYNRQLHNERQVQVEVNLVSKRMSRRRRRKILLKYAGTGKQVYVIEGDKDWPAVVCGESRHDKMRIRVCIVESGKMGFFYPHIDDIILHPRPV